MQGQEVLGEASPASLSILGNLRCVMVSAAQSLKWTQVGEWSLQKLLSQHFLNVSFELSLAV